MKFLSKENLAHDKQYSEENSVSISLHPTNVQTALKILSSDILAGFLTHGLILTGTNAPDFFKVVFSASSAAVIARPI